MACLIASLWIALQRPPLRTLGETRLWYALLLPLIGLMAENRLGGARALRAPALAFGILFAGISLARPQAMDRTLMPALQSPWFIPHVVVYMIAYAALGLSCGMAAWALARCRDAQERLRRAASVNALVRAGFLFLTLGLIFGALWAKEAWGHYWSWDPKETWAFLTWVVYLSLVHHGLQPCQSPRRNLALSALAFSAVLGCWFLVNWLPAASQSVHTYGGS